MTASGRGRTRGGWVPVLLLLVALGALVLAAPAAAQNRQEAEINQSCGSGSDSNGEDSGGDSSSSDGGNGGDCRNQDRVVQQSAGGDVSRSINQSQTFGDDDRVRANDDDENENEDEFEAEEEEEDDVSASSEDFDCEDFSSQSDAQAVLDEDSGDPFDLDSDGDDRACEDEFGQSVRGAPEGGVETGGGGTLTPQLSRSEERPGGAAEIGRYAGPPLALALIVAGLLGLRRGRST